jgi:hypothetical protein
MYWMNKSPDEDLAIRKEELLREARMKSIWLVTISKRSMTISYNQIREIWKSDSKFLASQRQLLWRNE